MNQYNIASKYAGVDVGKKTLDCWKPATRNKGGSYKSFDNNAKGIAALLRWLPEGCHVVLESTGPYGEPLVFTCHNLGVPVSVVNPGSVRDLARAHGQRAKTDKLDAELIARFAESVRPEPLPKPTKAQMALRAHVDLREDLVCERTRHLCRLAAERNPALQAILERQVVAHLGQAIAALENQIDAIVASCPRLTAMRRQLRAIPGIGPVISATMVAFLPELGTLSRKQVAALCGLAPYARDSGARKGKRFISGGRAKLRRRLYMGAVSVVKTRTPLAAQHKAMVARGKEKKVSLIAVARKLAIRANTLCKPLTSIPYAND